MLATARNVTCNEASTLGVVALSAACSEVRCSRATRSSSERTAQRPESNAHLALSFYVSRATDSIAPDWCAAELNRGRSAIRGLGSLRPRLSERSRRI